MILPADISPVPMFAVGMMRLKTGFSGSPVRLRNPANSQILDIGYTSDGKLDEAALDSFRSGSIVRVINWTDQINSHLLSASNVRAPKIGALKIGLHRCVWMEGDGQVENVAPDGQIYGMDTSQGFPTANLAIKGNDFTVMQVLQHHSGVYFNNAGGVGSGTMFAMSSGGLPLHRFQNNGAGDLSTWGGVYTVTDGTITYNTRNGGVVETSPIIQTCIVGAQGIFVGQNEDFRSTIQTSSNASVADRLYIGYHEDSVDGGTNESAGCSMLLTMVWNKALTLGQAAGFRGALYDLVGINHLQSRSTSPIIITFTDSVWAGYKGDDFRSWDKRIAPALSSRARWVNFALPGGPIMSNGGPPVAYDLGRFEGWVKPIIRSHKGKVHCVWGCPLNDYNITPRPTPQEFYDDGLRALMSKIRAVDPQAAFTICTSADSSDPNVQTWRHSIDTLIRNGASANQYAMIDVAADPFMADWNLCTKDGTHHNNAGFDKLGELLKPRIEAWLGTVL